MIIFDTRTRGDNSWVGTGGSLYLLDTRTRGDNSKPRLERVVVTGE